MWKPVGHYDISICIIYTVRPYAADPEECRTKKIEKKPYVCAYPYPWATTCSSSLENSCVRKIVRILFSFFLPVLLCRVHIYICVCVYARARVYSNRRRHGLAADKTKSKRLYRLGENKSFVRTLVGTLSCCPVVANTNVSVLFALLFFVSEILLRFYCPDRTRFPPPVLLRAFKRTAIFGNETISHLTANQLKVRSINYRPFLGRGSRVIV